MFISPAKPSERATHGKDSDADAPERKHAHYGDWRSIDFDDAEGLQRLPQGSPNHEIQLKQLLNAQRILPVRLDPLLLHFRIAATLFTVGRGPAMSSKLKLAHILRPQNNQTIAIPEKSGVASSDEFTMRETSKRRLA
jgi:hypothetical protein